ncbi:flagellar hook-associated protein FlgK [Rhodococcus sp. X156]|uniref:flagellar hook-associated protein FlgK n=1 Tax=Rhodococcus sp. X156 TaxID=2499145 RepID=UPI000FD72732|nr:flagellar hook-associated protein FlgK [Rhodococcus sp. X156]
MSSTFAGISTAMSGLAAQRYALDVTGQNINNAGVAGYTRQRADLASVGPVAGVPSMYSTPHAATGVTIAGTSRLNDPVVDARARVEHGQNGYLQTSAGTLSSVEGLFLEPSDTGLSEELNGFWKSWTEVANHPGNLDARNVVLVKAAGLAASITATAGALQRLTEGVGTQLAEAAGKVDTSATALAEVNRALTLATATGSSTNALADQRDSLLMTLADLTGAQSTITRDGSATVVLGGRTLVSGGTAATVAAGPGGGLTVAGEAPAGRVGGVLGSLSDALATVLPGYAARLDTVAAGLAESVNAVQTSGYTLAGAAGTALFTGTTAATLRVAVTDPADLAASASPGGNLDGSLAGRMAALGTAPSGADARYRQLVSTLGSEVQATSRQAAVQQALTTSVDDLAQAASGVSLDEETANLLTYQRAYQAASRVLSTVDEMLDTLISRTGRVGL